MAERLLSLTTDGSKYVDFSSGYLGIFFLFSDLLPEMITNNEIQLC
jgi:hypothetical protein